MGLQIIFLALLISAPASARMGSSWGSSIVIVDVRTGNAIREIAEPCMLAGHTFSSALVDLETSEDEKRLKVRWDDVIFSTRGYADTAKDKWGAPEARLKRELIFSIPEFSTHSTSSVGTWRNVELSPLPSTVVTDQNYEATVTIRTKDSFYISRSGEALDAFNLSSGKKIWTLNLNHKNNPLPGGGPSLIVFEHRKILLIASDRLGLHAVDRSTGERLWHLPYHNLDVIPKLALIGSRLVVAPADMQDIECSQQSGNNK